MIRWRIRRVYAFLVVLVILIPIYPFMLIELFLRHAMTWAWPNRVLECAERWEQWSRKR